MGTIYGANGNAVNLSTAQAGNAEATNRAQRQFGTPARAAMMRIIAATGGPCTYFIEGSGDNVNFWPLPNIDLAAVGTLVDASFTISTPATMWRMIPVDIPWTYLRITYSANTGMVNTTDLWIYS